MPASEVAVDRQAKSQTEDQTFDVFISYSTEDREWVKEHLLQPLEEEAGLKVLIDFRDFHKGRLITDNIEWAIETCPHVVAVVSEASVASGWVSQEVARIINKDPGSQKGILIPVLKDGEIPEHLKIIVAADFRESADRELEFNNLCRDLGAPPKKLDRLASRKVSKGLEALFELMRTPEVKQAAGDFRDAFRETSKQIESLSRYKRLHDHFQAAEKSYGNLFVQKQRLQSEDLDWWEVDSYADGLDSDLGRVTEYAAKAGFRRAEVLDWPRILGRAVATMRDAIESEDLKLLDRALQKMHQVFGTIPSRLNRNMVAAAIDLPLEELASKLELIWDRLSGVQFRAVAQTRLLEFRRGIKPLKRLRDRLDVLVMNHDCLQSIDEQLRLHGDFPHHIPSADEVRDFWIDMGEATRALSVEGGGWIETLQEIADDLDVKVARACLDDHKKADEAIRKSFGKYWGKIHIGFDQVNVDLRDFCDQLKDVGAAMEFGIAGLER